MTEQEARRILQVEDESSSETIRESYLHLVKVWHPDRFEHDRRLRARAERTLRDVNEAYAVLQQRRGSRSPAAPHEGSRPAAGVRTSPAPKGDAPLRVTLSRALFAGVGFGVLLAIAFASWPTSAPALNAPTTDTPIVADVTSLAPAVSRPGERQAAPADKQRPLSGTGLAPAARRGNGSVAIYNEGARDAAFVLGRDGVHVHATYVRAGEKVQIVGIAQGEYDVLVTVGNAWRGDRFTIDATFLTQREPLQVREPAAGERIDRAAATLVLPGTPASAGFGPTEPFRVQLP